ncbi:HAD-IA family hydrolase [candidate division KSB1 bacterium]|nr:HAD-IA family hydrolase [candidate division KSB1 bacterium]
MSKKANIAVIFDMDGVLVDSEPVIEAAAIRGLAEFGVNAQPSDFIPFIGTGEIKYIGGVSEKYGVAYQTAMKNRVYEIYLEIVDEKLKVQPGARHCLANLRRDGVPLVLASSADRIKINANLRVAGIPQNTFEVILSAEDVVHKKPSPEIYLKSAEKLGLPPDKCIVIEDALNGIQSAKAAGMACLAVSSTFDRKQLAREAPDHICDDLNEVFELIRRLYI